MKDDGAFAISASPDSNLSPTTSSTEVSSSGLTGAMMDQAIARPRAISDCSVQTM